MVLKHSMQQILKSVRSFSTVSENIPKICVVGSGPGGFYSAMKLLRLDERARLDIYEKYPVPFGLVRYGVAPDHPELKAVNNQFTHVLENPRVNFVGNVEIGKHVSLSTLRNSYNVVVLAYGTNRERELGILGEENVISGKKMVGWYNSRPEDVDFEFNANADEVVIIGVGNVAIDLSRILLKNVDELRHTDISDYALEALSRSKVRKVHMVGRRGPLQAAFTIPELRELINLPGCHPIVHEPDFNSFRSSIPDLSRALKRKMELLLETAINPPKKENLRSTWELHFFLSPHVVYESMLPNSFDVKFYRNEMKGYGKNITFEPTNDVNVFTGQMIIRSIGYTGVSIDEEIPMDEKRGFIENLVGRIEGKSNVYCSGWLQSGATGMLVTTRNDSFDAVNSIKEDIDRKKISLQDPMPGFERISQILKEQNIQIVDFEGWKKINAVELERGAAKGKPRCKISSIKEMLEIAQ